LSNDIGYFKNKRVIIRWSPSYCNSSSKRRE